MRKTLNHNQSLERRLEIIYRPIADLKPDPANARQHSKQQIRQLARSIEQFNFNVPVLVDAELNVIAGHCRLLACPELGITEVPTLQLDHLSQAQARAFMIADNRLAEIASWDDRLLAQQLKDLSLRLWHRQRRQRVRRSDRAKRCSVSTSASSSPALRWAKSTCGLLVSRQMLDQAEVDEPLVSVPLFARRNIIGTLQRIFED